MSFDQEPDDDIHGICAYEIRTQRKALEDIRRHVQFIRHSEKRYLEVGKEKTDWAKLNGPLSAIERCLAEGLSEQSPEQTVAEEKK